jgi:hypothetical protein
LVVQSKHKKVLNKSSPSVVRVLWQITPFRKTRDSKLDFLLTPEWQRHSKKHFESHVLFWKIEIYESFQVSSTFGKMNLKNLQESSVKQCAEFKLKQFALRLQEHYNSMNFSQMNEKAVKAEMVQFGII